MTSVLKTSASVLKNSTKRTIANVGSGLNRAWGHLAGNDVGILMYHRVIDRVPRLERPSWNVTPAVLRQQMIGLLEKGFKPWPLRQVIEYHHLDRQLPSKVFVVTFDDGHESVYLNAWPILRSLEIPATVFLATAFLDRQSPFPFDDWAGAGSKSAPIESWRPLSSAQCQQMSQEGLFELGAHTHTHQLFANRTADFRDDLAFNIEQLRTNFQVTNPAFAFPYGQVTTALLDAAKSCSVSCALTTLAVLNRTQDSPFGWGRFDVEHWDTAGTLAAKLGGWYSFAPKLRQRFQEALSLRSSFKMKRESCVR